MVGEHQSQIKATDNTPYFQDTLAKMCPGKRTPKPGHVHLSE